MTISLLFALAQSDPKIPAWPKQYHLRGFWSIPYQGIRVPFKTQTDYINNRQSDTSYENLLNEVHLLNDKIYQLQVSEIGDSCHYSTIPPGEDDELTEYLPLNNNKWKYIGESVVNGHKCNGWERPGDREDWFYRFFVDLETGDPVQYFMNGTSIRGSHPAIYIFDIEEWGPTIDENLFIVPSLNQCVQSTESAKKMKDLKSRKPKNSANSICTEYEQRIFDDLPINFSWRDVPHVLPYPHDQAVCGSCWAQGAMGSISGALSIKAGRNVVASVQQIIDCTWGNINFACDGGEHDDAYTQLINKNISLAVDDEYPYLGIGGYCAHNFSQTVGRVTGCHKVKSESIITLKSALYEHGPIAVGIIADKEGFSSLGDQVYEVKECKGPKGIDHSVLLTGWKKVGDKEAWEIMNSWSDRWGYEGFGLISMEYDCGITYDAFFPDVVYEEKAYD